MYSLLAIPHLLGCMLCCMPCAILYIIDMLDAFLQAGLML